MPKNAGHFPRRVPEEKRLEVARLRAAGRTQRAIADETGLSRSTVAYLEKQPDVRANIQLERGRERARQRRRTEGAVEAKVVRREKRRRVTEAAMNTAVALDCRRKFHSPYMDFLDERDAIHQARARNRALGRTPEGSVPVRWPGGNSSYDLEDESDIDRVVALIASFCIDLDPDLIRTRLLRANTKTYGAVVIDSGAARKKLGLPVDWLGNPANT
jgi:transcriptional regulator